MAKTEYKVGEVFQYGNCKLRVEKAKQRRCDACDDCFFIRNKDECINACEITGSCDANTREDKTDVIFVKVEE